MNWQHAPVNRKQFLTATDDNLSPVQQALCLNTIWCTAICVSCLCGGRISWNGWLHAECGEVSNDKSCDVFWRLPSSSLLHPTLSYHMLLSTYSIKFIVDLCQKSLKCFFYNFTMFWVYIYSADGRMNGEVMNWKGFWRNVSCSNCGSLLEFVWGRSEES